MSQRQPLTLGADGLPQQLQAGDTIATGLRIETYTSSAGNASGVASVTFSPAFTTVPTVIPLCRATGATVTVGEVTAITKTGCTLALATSRGTLLLSSGPFQVGQGSTISVVVFGS